MRLSHIGICVLGLGLTVVAAQGCGSSDDTTGGGGGSAGGGATGSGGTSGGAGAGGTMAGTGGGGGGAMGGAAGARGGAGGSASAAKTTYIDVKPVFMAKCTPCHMVGGTFASVHSLASSYDDAVKASYSCPGKKKGECTLERVKKGDATGMPSGKGCKGIPAMDKDNPACLTQAEMDKLDAWVKDGILEK